MPDEPPPEPPSADPTPSEDAGRTPVPQSAVPAAGRPLWKHLAVPFAIIVGAAIIAGAVWYTRDDGSADDDVLRALTDLQAQIQAMQGVPADTGGDGAGVSTAQDLRGTFADYAKQVGSDTTKFQACLAKPEHLTLLNRQLQRGSSLGVTGTPTFVINNKKVVGAQPQALFEEIIQAELNGSPTAVTQYSAAIQQLAATTPPRFEILASPVDISDAQIEGNKDARVVIAEFSDFQCPFCKRWSETTMDPLLKKYGNNVALAFLHFPLTQIHPNAGNASVAAICAGEQGKFWEMHDLLFARQAEWSPLR